MADPVTLAPEKPAKKPSPNGAGRGERERVFDLFRRFGFSEATLDPLGFFAPVTAPELAGLSGGYADEARRYYCGTVGVEFAHVPEADRRNWIAERWEGPETEVDRKKILERLVRADLFEQILHSRYLGSNRFSLEGETALIPLLDPILDAAGNSAASIPSWP